MERPGSITNSEHIVDIASSASASTPGGSDPPAASASSSSESRPQALPSNAPISNNPTMPGRSADGSSRGRISLLVSKSWVWLQPLIAVTQIVGISVSLALVQDSRDGNSRGPFRTLIVAYLFFRVVGLLLLCWDYCRQRLPPFQILDGDFSSGTLRARSVDIINCSRILLNVYFVLWAVSCFYCVIKWSLYPDVSPIFYGLCEVFLFHPLFRFACLLRRFMRRTYCEMKASTEAVNGFPTYTFKLNRCASSNDREGGILARGTNKERLISAEDAVCVICLGKYEDGDELRELACLHLYHKGCVDQWLKVHAACPCCRHKVNASVGCQETSAAN